MRISLLCLESSATSDSLSPSVSFSAQITKHLEEGFDTDIPFRAQFGVRSSSKKERETYKGIGPRPRNRQTAIPGPRTWIVRPAPAALCMTVLEH